MLKPAKPDSVGRLSASCANDLGRLLHRVEDERRSVVIEKRGTPRAVLMSIRDCVRLAVPEPEVLRIIGEESESQGTDRLSGQQIEKIIRQTRPKQFARPGRPKRQNP
jgi:prevent-host-death family protein